MMGHGHVTPNPDGSKARCGGPGICLACSLEADQVKLDALDLEVGVDLGTGDKSVGHVVIDGVVYELSPEELAVIKAYLSRSEGER